MDDSNDIPSLDDIGDMPILGGPAETTSTATETTTEPVQPAAPNTSTTETNAEGEPTSPIGNQGTETPASESTPSEPTGLTEGQTPQEQSNLQHQAWIARQQAKQEAEQRFQQNYNQLPTEQEIAQELIEGGMDEDRAQIKAMYDLVQLEREKNTMLNLTSRSLDDTYRIQSDFGIFNPNSPDYDEDFAIMVGNNYQKDANFAYEGEGENMLVKNADRPLYDYYQQWYNSYNRGLSKGQQKAQANTEQMIARTENPGGSSSKTVGDLSQEEFLAQYGDMPLF